MEQLQQQAKKTRLSEISIPIELLDDHLSEKRQELLNYYKLDTQNQKINYDGELNQDLLNCVRISRITEQELYFFEKQQPISIISPHNELYSCLYLHKLFKRLQLAAKAQESDEYLALTKASHKVIQHYATLVQQTATPSANQIIQDSNQDLLLQRLLQEMVQTQEQQQNTTTTEAAATTPLEKITVSPKLQVKKIEQMGRGLVSNLQNGKEQIDDQEVLVQIPSHWILCCKTALEHPVVGDVFLKLQQEAQLEDDLIMILYAMYEHANQSSRWKPYFDMMAKPRKAQRSQGTHSDSLAAPSAATAVASGEEEIVHYLYFSEEDIHNLNECAAPTLLGQEVSMSREKLEHEIGTVLLPFLHEQFPQVFSPHDFTYDRFCYIKYLVDSRAFFFEGLGTGLIPFLDFANTTVQYPHLIGTFDTTQNKVLIRTIVPVHSATSSEESSSNGDVQLFISYGAFPNRTLLQNHGMLFTANPYDTFNFQLDLATTTQEEEEENEEQETSNQQQQEAQELLEFKTKLLEKYGLTTDHSLRNGPLPSKLLAFMRISVMNKQDVIHYQQQQEAQQSNQFPFAALSTSNEETALVTLQETLHSLRRQFYELLNEEEASFTSSMISNFSAIQADILEGAIEQVNEMLEMNE